VKTLRARLAVFYAIALALVLAAFAATAYAIVEAEEAEEPPEVAALEPPTHTGQRFLIALGAALPVAIAIAVGGAVVIARRGLKPLDDVIATAERVGDAESLRERVPVAPGSVDEAARLVAAVNAMLARLDRSVAGMRRFTADASHELRTPLGALLGELELTLRRPRSEEHLRGVVEAALEQLGRMSRLVEALLMLARSDAQALPVAPVAIDLVEAVKRAVEPYEAVMAGKSIRLEWRGAPAPVPVMVRADPLWLGRVVANLVDNACKFTPAGGTITVAVAVAADGARARVDVSDSGPGIADADRERVFERFHRGTDARAGGADGFGLGLPLARELARAMAGDVRAEPAERGARFVLDLPRDGA
jgi:two-component system, OmpR family, sensor kinase